MHKRIYLMRPSLDKSEIIGIKKVLDSKFLTEGNVTLEFEKKIAKYVNSKYAIATTSATTALHTAFDVIGVKNKEVLVSDFTFPATVLAIIQAGGKPILTDVDKNTMNVNRNIIENISKKIEFVCPVALFGNSLEEDFYKLRKRGTKIIEDAATNLGTKINGKPAGSLADITCFSFHPRKIITTGEGGMITTNNVLLKNKIKSFKNFGKNESSFMNFGTNYKLSDLQSAVGIAQLKKIEKIIKKRRKQAKIYDELLSKINLIQTQEPVKKSRHTYQSYVCKILKPRLRDKLIKKLMQANIETQIGTYALHCLPAFKKLPKEGKLFNSKFLFENSISLPLHDELTMKDQEYIVKKIKEIIGNTP